MIIIIGAVTVVLCVFGGFVLEGGHLTVLLEAFVNEVLIIAGGAAGSLIIMSPKKCCSILSRVSCPALRVRHITEPLTRIC